MLVVLVVWLSIQKGGCCPSSLNCEKKEWSDSTNGGDNGIPSDFVAALESNASNQETRNEDSLGKSNTHAVFSKAVDCEYDARAVSTRLMYRSYSVC